MCEMWPPPIPNPCALVHDLLYLLQHWGPCTVTDHPTWYCPADLNCDGVVDVSDVLLLLTVGGAC